MTQFLVEFTIQVLGFRVPKGVDLGVSEFRVPKGVDLGVSEFRVPKGVDLGVQGRKG